MANKLTDKQELAVKNYCLKGIINAEEGYSWSQAMRDAGYKEGYITKCQFSLRRKPQINKLIEKTKKKVFDTLELDALKVITELSKVAFSNINDYLSIDEESELSFKDFQGIDNDKLAAIESIKVNKTTKDKDTTYTTTQFKLHSKLNALEQLGKHFGIYGVDNAQKQPQTANIVFIDGTRTAKQVESMLIEKQAGMGNAICTG